MAGRPMLVSDGFVYYGCEQVTVLPPSAQRLLKIRVRLELYCT